MRVLPRQRFSCLAIIALAIGLSGCPKRQTQTVEGVGQGSTIEVPNNGDQQARSRFEMNRNRFQQDASVDASEEFEAIVREFPNDPIVPHALVYGAMADVRKGDRASAQTKLKQVFAIKGVDAALVGKAHLWNGFILAALGQYPQAYAELKGGEASRNREDAEETKRWLSALAESAAHLRKRSESIAAYDAWWSTATDSEKSYIQDQITALVKGLSDAELQPVFLNLQDRRGPGAAIVGGRLAPYLIASENPQSEELLVAIANAQRAMGMRADLAGDSGPGNPDIIGALLPITGRLNRVGELSLRAMVMASGQSPMQTGGDSLGNYQVVAQDTNSTATLVSQGLKNLVAEEVIAVVGPFDSQALRSAAPLANQMGLPLVSLAPRGAKGKNVFSIRHSAEERARALAKYAYQKGIRSFAILSPMSSYGKVVGKAFRKEVEALGGTVVVEASYPKGTTSFKSHIAKLRKPWSAIFVPDLAKSLQLVAPALAVSNFHAKPVGSKSKRGRAILLLSTAEGLSQSYLRAAGRYSEGAAFAPGFYPDRTDDRIAEFVSRYEAEFGSEPSSHEAYAWDAAAVIRHAINLGANTRQLLGAALHDQRVEGLTGTISFDSKGRRSDSGLLFEVRQPIQGQFELNALR